MSIAEHCPNCGKRLTQQEDLRTEVERLRAALREIAAPQEGWQSCSHGSIARRALEGK